MDPFAARQGVLHAEDVGLPALAARFGTPLYVYSRAAIGAQVEALRQGLAGVDHRLCYAVKANGSLALLQLLAAQGCDFDAVSEGELRRVRAACGPGAAVIVSGVGKTDEEIAAALEAEALYVSVESAAELAAVSRIAAACGRRAPVCLRVNPDVDAQTHPHISTGMKQNKFGVPMAAAAPLYAAGTAMAGVHMLGLTCHIGSQILSLTPFVDAAQRLAQLVAQLREAGYAPQVIGMGGGLGIAYGAAAPPSPAAYGAALAAVLGPLRLPLVLEPGRLLVGNAGILLARVVRCKQGAEASFVLLDAGMNDLLRPALYGASHAIEPVRVGAAAGLGTPVDIVGPVCESADTFGRGRCLPPLAEGDLVAIRGVGAYGFCMASNYNGRRRPAEALVDGTEARLIRRRESFADLWRGELLLDGTPA